MFPFRTDSTRQKGNGKKAAKQEVKKAKGHQLQLADETKADKANGKVLWAVEELENKTRRLKAR